jgi:predicted PurR-regulated permease PerM
MIKELIINNKVKLIINNKVKLISVAIIVIILVPILMILWKQMNTISNLKQEVNKVSVEETIIKLIKDWNEEAKQIDTSIKELESKKETNTLKVICLKAQLNRLVEGLEYSLEYCDSQDNLKKFSEGLG